MLTWEESLEAQALRDRGWTITTIARHLDRDPKTIRAYLSGERSPGVRRRSSAPDPFAPFVPYVTQRLGDDKHLWATTLYDEVVELRLSRLLPVVHPCAAHPRAAPVVSGVRGGEHPGPGDHRPPGRRGDSVGLGRAARPAGRVGAVR